MRTIGDYHRAVIHAATSARLKGRLRASDLAGLDELLDQGAHLPATDQAFERVCRAIQALIDATDAAIGIRSIEVALPAAEEAELGEALLAYCRKATSETEGFD